MDRASAFGGWPLITSETNTTQSSMATGSVSSNSAEGRKNFWGRTTDVINGSCPTVRTERDSKKGDSDLYQELKKQLPNAEAHNLKSQREILSEYFPILK